MTVLPSLPNRTGATSVPGQRRTQLPMLAEQVEVVVGVDFHKHTHTAAVVGAATPLALSSPR
jgi:hypothetical protein